MMERLLSMSHQETVFRGLIILKTKKLKSSPAQPLTQQVRPLSLVTSIDSMFITLTPRDLSGMKFAVNKSKTTTVSQPLPGKPTAQELASVHFVDQLMSLMSALKNQDIRENSNLPMSHFLKSLLRKLKPDKDWY